jgi:Spy/CpxP family protein refolding chaperone
MADILRVPGASKKVTGGLIAEIAAEPRHAAKGAIEMRRIMWFAVAAFVLAISPRVWANESAEAGKAGWKGGGEKWGKELGLSADQQAKLKAIGENQRAEIQPLRERLKALRKEIKELVDAKAGDDKISAKLDELGKVRADIQAARRKYAGQREAVLTPSQRAKSILQKGDKAGKAGKIRGHGCPGGSEKEKGKGVEGKE